MPGKNNIWGFYLFCGTNSVLLFFFIQLLDVIVQLWHSLRQKNILTFSICVLYCFLLLTKKASKTSEWLNCGQCWHSESENSVHYSSLDVIRPEKIWQKGQKFDRSSTIHKLKNALRYLSRNLNCILLDTRTVKGNDAWNFALQRCILT